VTDSARVPWGKGEKHPDEGSERDPETGCLQAVGGGSPKVSPRSQKTEDRSQKSERGSRCPSGFWFLTPGSWLLEARLRRAP